MNVSRRTALTMLAGAAWAPAAAFAQNANARGLKADTAEDQTATLMRLAERAAKAGHALAIGAGRYHISGADLPAGLSLIGVPGATRLVATKAAEPILRLSGGEARLRGLAFEGLPVAGTRDMHLVSAENVAHLDIRDCRFSLAPGIALALRRCGGHVGDCRFETIGDAALFALDSAGLTIAGNFVRDCGNNGIQIWRSRKGDDGTRISGNRISHIAAKAGGSGQFGNAISLFRAGGCIVDANTIRNVAYSAIRANSAPNVQMLGNNAADCDEVAFYVEFGFDGAVVANNLAERAAVGISVTNFDHGGRLAVVQGNVLRKLRKGRLPQGGEGGGIGIHVEAETAVTGNVVEEADEAGLLLGWGEGLNNVVATGNLVRGAGHGIAVSVAPGAGKAHIANNFITGARAGAIVAKEWNKVVAADLTRDGAGRYPNLTILGNRVAP